ncbi:MAG TPA: pilus assembly FimT family protein [Candidatus Hypogeohydataceae bacterium YC41]
MLQDSMVSTRCKKLSGYTLVELLVLLCIVLTILGIGVPRVVSTMGALEFRRGVMVMLNFLRQAHLDSVVKGNTLTLKLEESGLARSDGKKFLLPTGLQLGLSRDSKDPILAMYYPSGRSNSQRFFIKDIHGRSAAISIDPLSSIPECKYY